MTGASRWAWALCLLASCHPSKPAPTPSPSPTVTVAPTPTPEPTAPATACPEIVPSLVKIRCGRFSDWQDGEQWDCEPIYFGQVILPEGDPDRARCDLEAVGGEAPEYMVEVVTGDLRAAPRVDQSGQVRPFRFALYGRGKGVLRCFVADGHDACRDKVISR